MYTKAQIYNLALGALLLSRQISDPLSDKSNECKVLNTHWDAALKSTLEDLDLDSTSMIVPLEQVATNPNQYFNFAYKYPSKCALFRRVASSSLTDNSDTQITKRIGLLNVGGFTQKVIFTNEEIAYGEIVPIDFPIEFLTASAGLAVAYRLAMLSTPLVVGKGSGRMMKEIQEKYNIAKMEAQETDRLENFNYQDPSDESEFVRDRMS